MKRLAMATLAALCLWPGWVSAVPPHVWTDKDGQAFDGQLVRMEGTTAVFAVEGREVRVPLTELSVVDRAFIFRQFHAAPVPAATPVPSAAPGVPDAAATEAAANADAAFNAYNAAFLVKSGGKTFYRKSSTDPAPNRLWVQATTIQLAEDAYDRTHSGVNRQLVMDLVNSFLVQEGPKWGYDSWNDDIAWMSIACIRGYQITGSQAFLNAAASNWKMAYDRGWDAAFGGGIWEDNAPKDSKNALSNNPMVVAGCALYQITHDPIYLTRCRAIYAWARENLFDTATGQVNEGIAWKGKLSSDNVYNSGAFVNAANSMHNVTGEEGYYRDALLAADHVTGKQAVLSHGNRGENCWSDQFARGLIYFCRDNKPLWGRYHAWIMANARSSWASRRPDLNITWNDWLKPTPTDDCSSLECLGAAVLQQMVPMMDR